jgi:hypothetical protein
LPSHRASQSKFELANQFYECGFVFWSSRVDAAIASAHLLSEHLEALCSQVMKRRYYV